MIPQEKIEEIKNKGDIVEIVSQYVPSLKKRGKNHLGLCPFHSEKTASFTVSQEKGVFHCFGCGEGGNIFSFLMKMENISFAESVKLLGDKVGIPVEIDNRTDEETTREALFYSIVEIACKFYENNLDKINDYLEKRKIKNPKKFRLGFAPDGWDSLLNFLISKGVKENDAELLGLVVKNQGGTGFFDRFRNRLIFPITDLKGRVVGFGGRAIGDDEPKYLNSPESPIFNKGSLLYNLASAKNFIKEQKFALLVEGYMDVVAPCEEGLLNVVAPLGTSLTSEQARILRRITDTVVIAFDSDKAGVIASERGQEVLKEAELTVRIVSLERAKDPDEFIKKFGIGEFVKRVKNSLSANEFKLRRIISRHKLSDPEEKAKATHEVAKFLALEKDKILAKEYASLAGSIIGISSDIITEEVDSYRSFSIYKRGLSSPIIKPSSRYVEAEKNLIRLMLEWDESIPKIKETLTLDNFVIYKNIAEKLFNPSDGLVDVVGNDEDGKIIREFLISEAPMTNKEKILEDCLNTMKSYELSEQIKVVREKIVEAEKDGLVDEARRLNEEFIRLNEILISFKR